MTILVTEVGQEIWPVVKESLELDVSKHFQKRLRDDGAIKPKHYDVISFF